MHHPAGIERRGIPREYPAVRSREARHDGRAAVVASAAAALAAAALVNHRLARNAERRNPPRGRFIDVEGIRLHYVEAGRGQPLVLLHGNGSMLEDFLSSGLVDLAARNYRVIVFDRPGYGYSDRPRARTPWTPQAQADLIRHALHRIGARDAIVLGHSWGALVAVSLGLRHPKAVRALVLESGYFYPRPRADVVVLSGPGIPVLGDILSHTISPILSRVMWPLFMRRIFGPAPVPEKFRRGFPKEMVHRPSQIRTSAAEAALMVPSAFRLSRDYRHLDVPVVIIAGNGDRMVNPARQSARLHREVAQSRLRRIPGNGHMVHQTATKRVMAAIEEATSLAAIDEVAGMFARRGGGGAVPRPSIAAAPR